MAEPILLDDRDSVGHAILRFAAAREVAPSVALRSADATFLGVDGRRGRGRHLFATEVVDSLPTRDFRLGPEVTAHVREAEVVTLIEADGNVLGTLVWEGIRVPPVAGAGARLGAGGAGGKTRAHAAAPTFARTTRPAASVASAPAVDDAATAELPPSARPARRRRGVLALTLSIPCLAIVTALLCVLTGTIGWRLEPTEIAFAGPSDAFVPSGQEVRLVLAWYAKPLLSRPPIAAEAAPAWLDLRQKPATYGWTIDIAPSASARGLAPGRREARLPLAFPLRTSADALTVSLFVEPSETVAVAPTKPPAAPTVDDAVCDRLAGNRYDGDHPNGVGFTDEIFTLSQADLEAGLAACDPSLGRTGADRRFAVQRGRLLAHRALLRLSAGDVAGATSDMDAAVALWRHGDVLGSAYAVNLLGAYHEGTFNRPSHSFVAPDDRTADALWKKGMEGGNVVAERNYAAQLLAGRGVAADPAKALVLLRDAAAKGDLHASAVLGVALCTGTPSGVARDEAAGWPLVVAAQCVDRGAAALVERAVGDGTQPASVRHACR